MGDGGKGTTVSGACVENRALSTVQGAYFGLYLITVGQCVGVALGNDS